MNNLSKGTQDGTGALIEINCGFVPSKVDVYNTEGDAILLWVDGMGSGKGYKILGTGLGALIASGGIILSVETDDFIGFSIGADADVNVNGEELTWVAYR